MMLFVLSTGRSGTTTVARWLSAVGGVTSLHEPEPAFIREASALRYGDLAPDAILETLQATRPRGATPIYAESSQTLALLVPQLVALWPDARFVWLLRNGRDVVASAMQKQWYSGHSETHARYEDATPTQQAWIDGRLRADKWGDMDSAEWQSLSRFGKCCWYWQAVNRIIAQDVAATDIEPFVLKLETLPAQADALLTWLGLPTPAPPVPQANTARRAPYDWRQWSAEERELFTRFCATEMDRWYVDWRDDLGRWQPIAYATPPRRNRLAFWLTSARFRWRNRKNG